MVILAGGKGTRLRAVVSDVPKPMASVAGRPFLSHIMNHWAAQGVSRFVLLIGYMHEKISDHFGESFDGVPVSYEIENEPMGTGGKLLAIANKLGDAPVLIANGDTYFDIDLKSLEAAHTEMRADWTIAVFETADFERYGAVTTTDDGMVTGFGRSEHASPFVANGGTYLVQPKILAGHAETLNGNVSLEETLLPEMIRTGNRVVARKFDRRFLDIGIPSDYALASSVLSCD